MLTSFYIIVTIPCTYKQTALKQQDEKSNFKKKTILAVFVQEGVPVLVGEGHLYQPVNIDRNSENFHSGFVIFFNFSFLYRNLM